MSSFLADLFGLFKSKPKPVPAPVPTPPKPVPPAPPIFPIDKILLAAATSDISRYKWNDRGRAPIGYIKGMAVVYGKLLRRLAAQDKEVLAMVRVIDSPGDVFDHYRTMLEDIGIVTTGGTPVERLRALFVILFGLGMRESSGRYNEGRDMSASNDDADNAESGVFQQSWDSYTLRKEKLPELPKLLDIYSGNQEGFKFIFREGVNEKISHISGTGDGAKFQRVVKDKPAFAVEAAALGLRVVFSHWGPIIRYEVEVRPEAEELLRKVENIIGEMK